MNTRLCARRRGTTDEHREKRDELSGTPDESCQFLDGVVGKSDEYFLTTDETRLHATRSRQPPT